MQLDGLVAHPTARVISNPTSGGAHRRRELHAAIGVFVRSGWTVSWRETLGAGDARRLASEAATEGVDVVIAAGGDGTINEIVNGLVGSETAVAVLPAGTGNVFAAQLGLVGVPTPLHRPDLEAAAESNVTGTVKRVDLGHAQPRDRAGRHFIMVGGVGLDAEVTRAIEGDARELKRAIGPAAFGALGVKALFETMGTETIVRFDGVRRRERLLLGIVSNIRLYGGAVLLCPDAQIDDGQLDVELFFGEGPLSTVAHLGSVLTGRPGGPERWGGPGKTVRFCSATPLPVQVDGEPFATTPVTFTVRPAALRLLVPSVAPAELFRAGEPQALATPAL